MKIYWVGHNWENTEVQWYLRVHRLDYTVWDEWDADNNLVLPDEPFVIIMTQLHLLQMNELDRWIEEVNTRTDSYIFLTSRDETHLMKTDAVYDKVFRNPRFYVTLQGRPHSRAKPHHTPVPLHLTHELRGPQQPIFTKHTRDKDFLALMRVKANPERTPHRTLIYDELGKRKMLNNFAGKFIDERLDEDAYAKGWPIYDGFEYDSYLDPRPINQRNQSLLYSAVPWDLYNSANFEIVCESLFTKFSGPSEKTWKPINAQMPFLIASDQYFYEMLWDYGFKTFGDFVDETWHNHPDLEVRCMGIVDAAEKIIETGSNKFYNATREICAYNYTHAWSFDAKHRLQFWNDVKTLFDRFGIESRLDTVLEVTPEEDRIVKYLG